MPPSEDEVVALVERHMRRPGAPHPVSAVWSYARWKRGTSIGTAWTVRLENGETQIVALKRYAGAKALHLSGRHRRASRAPPGDLHASVVVPTERLHLWTPAGDRQLPGLARCLDGRGIKRLLGGLDLFPSRRVRSHRTRGELIRYRPERRAVVRLELGLKGAEGSRSAAALAARQRPLVQAARIAARRRLFKSPPGLPPFLGHDPRLGVLFEPWLDVRAAEPDAFEHAEAAGRLLGAVHGVPVPPEVLRWSEDADVDWPGVVEQLSWDPDLARALGSFRPPRRVSIGLRWTHGDLHPDQIAFGPGGVAWLLDLDRLAPRDPHVDLASWVSDRLAAQPGIGFEDAAAPLLAGYQTASQLPLREERLAALTAAHLVRAAAATCRRLEFGARERAGQLLALARRVAPAGSVFP